MLKITEYEDLQENLWIVFIVGDKQYMKYFTKFIKLDEKFIVYSTELTPVLVDKKLEWQKAISLNKDSEDAVEFVNFIKLLTDNQEVNIWKE